jgi:bifunctional non-homologous end joining protein LigD
MLAHQRGIGRAWGALENVAVGKTDPFVAFPVEIRDDGRVVRPSRLDQRWWPALGVRKRDVLAYYHRVAPVLLPHLRGRPFTLKQHYNGPRSPFRWLKDAPPELPDWVTVSPQPARSRGGEPGRYVVVDDELTLLWLVDYGCIDLHVWASRLDRPDRPDWVLFDLDPAGVRFRDVADAALLLRDALGAMGLASFVKTTGGDGLHVQVPVERRHTHAEARGFADIVARGLAAASDGLVTTERSLERRHGVFVDTKMNGHGQQAVAPYSVRPAATPAVATPLRWDEVEHVDPAALTIGEVAARIERGGDLFAPVLRGGQRLDSALRRLAA